MTEACAGVARPLRDVAWYVVPGAEQIPYGGDDRRVTGYYSRAGHRVVLAGEARFAGAAVRHEMLHALLRAPGHPRAAFLERCGGVTDCARDANCLREAGPPPALDPATPRVTPAALEVTAALAPAAPGAAVDGGLFTFTVSVRNPAPHGVVVALPTRPGSPPRSFPYEITGPGGTLVAAEDALDPGVTRFAPGETKRQVFDFAVGPAGLAPGGVAPGLGVGIEAFAPGAYTFRAAYGDHWAPPVTATLGP